MTPTLSGRWQIRLFLLSTVGLAISSLVALIIRSFLPLLALFYVLVVGCLLDMLYQYIQSFRWDRDWPTIFQVGAGVLEGLLVWFLLAGSALTGRGCARRSSWRGGLTVDHFQTQLACFAFQPFNLLVPHLRLVLFLALPDVCQPVF